MKPEHIDRLIGLLVIGVSSLAVVAFLVFFLAALFIGTAELIEYVGSLGG